MALTPNELTVKRGDLLSIIDDTKNDEWWLVLRLSDRLKGVVPASYIERLDGRKKDDRVPVAVQKEKESEPKLAHY
jgi:hypothetical protein